MQPLEAEAHNTQSTRLRGTSTSLHLWRGLRCSSVEFLIVPRDNQRPIRAASRRTLCAPDTSPGRAFHQKILAMPTRVDPLIESFSEAVVSVSDILGSV